MKDLATAVVWWRNGYLLSTAVPSAPIRTCYDRNRHREQAVIGIVTESDLPVVLVQQLDREAVEV